MAEFQVTSTSLNDKAAELNTIARSMSQTITELDALEKTLGGMWEGDAFSAFHNTYTQNEGKMTLFVNALEKYAATLSQIANNYHNAEVANIATAQSN